jgi:hypothetical protein
MTYDNERFAPHARLRTGRTNLEKDIVLQLIDEMNHLGHDTSGLLPIWAHQVIDRFENTSGTGHVPPPAAPERILDSLDSPQEIEELEILFAAVGSHYDIHRCLNLVLESENVPSNFTVRQLQHPGIKSSQDILLLELRVRPADRVL